MIILQATAIVAIILLIAALCARWLWVREWKCEECPDCGHSWAEHLWGRGCQRAGCCCQGGIPPKKEAKNGK